MNKHEENNIVLVHREQTSHDQMLDTLSLLKEYLVDNEFYMANPSAKDAEGSRTQEAIAKANITGPQVWN
jgi:hypothetical protein